jgi:hypothetical protein
LIADSAHNFLQSPYESFHHRFQGPFWKLITPRRFAQPFKLFSFFASRLNPVAHFFLACSNNSAPLPTHSYPIKMKFTILAVAGMVSTASAFTASSSFVSTTPVAHRAAASSSELCMKYKVAVVGGGPAGACAAEIFAQEKGIDTVLFERKLDNAKPCGGAIPLCMVGEFDLPETVVDRKVRQKIHCLQLLLLLVRLLSALI